MYAVMLALALVPSVRVAVDLPALSDPDFRTREAAHKRLETAQAHVLRAQLKGALAGALDPEGRARMTALMTGATNCLRNELQGALDHRYRSMYPQIDALGFDLEHKCYDRGRAVYGSAIDPYVHLVNRHQDHHVKYPNFETWREATRLYIFDLAWAGTPVTELDALMRKMYSLDQVAMRTYSSCQIWYVPPWWPEDATEGPPYPDEVPYPIPSYLLNPN